MSNRKTLESNMEGLEDEEESEHARLMNEQEQYENQSLQQLPNLDDDEYARMIQLSENYGRRDVNMEDFENNDDEEEKIPDNSRQDFGEHYQRLNNDYQDNTSGCEDQKHLNEQRSAFETNTSPQKKRQTLTSSFTKRTAFTKDSDLSSKYKTPQKCFDAVSFGKPSDISSKAYTPCSRRDPSEVIREGVVEQVKVRIEELQSKMKSKSDMFYVMRHMCGYHLPEYDDCPIQFMRDILAGTKKALKMESVRLIAVPFYDSLSVRRNWHAVKRLYPDVARYFPDYDPEYMPSRKFFWEIFASLHYDDAKTIISNERRRKYEKEASEKTKEIVISKDVLDLIQGSLYYSKKKGRALYNIKPKEYGNLPKRKRRLSETEGYQGEHHEISVFNIDRGSKRLKRSDEISTSLIKNSKNSMIKSLSDSNPFNIKDKAQDM